MNDDVAAALLALSGRHPFDRALAEPGRILGRALFHGVGDERGHGGAAAGQHAEDETDHRSAQDGQPGPEPLEAGRQGLPERQYGGLWPEPVLQVVEDLTDAEQAHRDDDEVDPVRQLVAAEGEPGGADDQVEPDGGEDETHAGRGDALDQGAVAQGGDQEDADQGEDGVLGRSELQCEVGDEGRDEGQQDDRPGAADEGADRGDAQG